jgi:hypothetical protein
MWSQCSYEDRGDGLLIVVRPGIPAAQVLEYLLVALPIALKRHSSIYGTGARIQLRVALDVGPVTSDDLGVSGQVIINAARLLEAPDLKDSVAANHANLGIVVSDSLRGWMQMVDPTLRSQRGVLTVTNGAPRGWAGQAG